MLSEEQIHFEICDFINKFYPDVIFLSDGSGLPLHIHIAKKFAKLKSNRGTPDLIVLEPKNGYFGLCVELKIVGVRIFKKDKTYTSLHIEEQAELLKKLSRKGYYACFALGYKSAKKIVDDYLSGRLT